MRLYAAEVTPQWTLHIRGCMDGDLIPHAEWSSFRVVRYSFVTHNGSVLTSVWYTAPADTRLLSALIQILPTSACDLPEVTPLWATPIGDLVPQDF